MERSHNHRIDRTRAAKPRTLRHRRARLAKTISHQALVVVR